MPCKAQFRQFDWTRYFDNNATTRPFPCALKEFERVALCANPSSVRYAPGRAAKSILDSSRERMASVLHVHPEDVTFTSGATEANNAIINSVAVMGRRGKKRVPHVVTTAAEHPSVSAPLEDLEQRGLARVTWVPLDEHGLVRPEDVAKAVNSNTALVVVIHAHGETGGINDLRKIADLVHAKNPSTVVHADCTQSAGKIEFWPWRGLHIDSFSASAHKLHGLKGTGVLVVNKRGDRAAAVASPLIKGGPQEHGYRAGTENVAGIAAMAEAFCHYARHRAENTRKLRELRDAIERGLREEGCLKRRLGPTLQAQRMPHTLLVAVNDDANFCNTRLVEKLAERGFQVSVGSACSTLSPKAPPIVRAMGLSDGLRSSIIRISPGINNTLESARKLVKAIACIVHGGRCTKQK